jgi:carbamoyltransferase
MMQVFQIRPEKRSFIPAVTHVDGSGRLQTVSKRTNRLYYSITLLLYYSLIDSFRDLTGVSMVLNTSFNENEPVVCEPRQALDCFMRTKMDMLVIGQTVLLRTDAERINL